MYLKKIQMSNWMCFVGTVEIELEPKVYAIVAHRKGDADSSNWAGKTSLLESIDFALYGRHRHRTEDAWITRGEKSGGVMLEFDNGITVARSRKLGKSTRFAVTIDGQMAVKEEAQKLLNERLGLDQSDFTATCYFEQRQMARLILAKPDERMGVISSWLRLEPLQEAEEMLRGVVSSLAWDSEVAVQNINTAKLAIEREGDLATLEEQVAEIDSQLVQDRTNVEELQGQVEQYAQLQAAKSKMSEYEAIVEEGKKVRATADKIDTAALTKAAERAAIDERASFNEMSKVLADVQTKRRLALGKFDGHCPVAEMECPAKQQINERREQNVKLAQAAEEKLKDAKQVHDSDLVAKNAVESSIRQATQVVNQLNVLREKVKLLMPDYEWAKANKEHGIFESVSLYEQLSRAQNRVVDSMSKLNVLKRSIATIKQADAEVQRHSDSLHGLETKLSTHREALVIFGKQGAQRRVAEGALTEIEAGANGMLRECGIDLNITVQWSREGSGLASSCDTCGHPFPASARVKECERCKSERGPKLVNKLEIILSDRSGAAEDLAGAALQLSASAWLRRDRASAWSTALIDEPFGQLDASHRRSFAAHLTSMLSNNYGFRQALVISHSSSTTDMLPGRIEIFSDGKRSTARVAA